MKRPGFLLVILILCGSLVYALASGNWMIGVVVSLIPIVFFFFIHFLQRPVTGLYLTLIWACVGLGIKRYLPADSGPGSALGLGVDVLLVFAWLSFFIKHFYEKFEFAYLKNGLMSATLIWFAYNVFEILNPEAPTFIGWFYAGRGVVLYMVLTIPLALMVLRERKHIQSLMILWFCLSAMGVIWGMKQLYLGLDFGELQWLADPGNRTTHLLFGKLRVFSFYSDSGQFGASMGHASIVAILVGIQSSGRKRYLFLACGLLFFYGMMISGTRGAMAVPLVGLITFLLVKKNWRLLIVGGACIGLAFGALKYTSVGSGIYEIQRMRTALDPNNPSLQIRVENQKKLFEYLKSHPFGGGVGSAGYWGQRFNPHSFLANLALDSWYVKIAAELGFPGLAVFVGFVLYVLIKGYQRISHVEDKELQHTLIALYCGIAGIAVASYGNQVWGQMPTGIILNISLAIIWNFSMPKINRSTQPVDRISTSV
jgi:hypothetical protein